MENRMTIEKYIQNQATSEIEDNCLKSTQDFLKLLSSKWTINILYVLNKNSIKRFGELKKEIPGITSVMLSSTLRKLEKFDVISRKQFNSIPPQVEYFLTEKGKKTYLYFLWNRYMARKNLKYLIFYIINYNFKWKKIFNILIFNLINSVGS